MNETHTKDVEQSDEAGGRDKPLVGRDPLTMEEIRELATYAPEGVTDADVEDLVRMVERMHGILAPSKA